MLDLYHHGSSVCAAKVRIALFEKQLEWSGHYVDILTGEQFEQDYLKINPKGVVPTLVHDGRIIPESTVICEYLEAAFGGNRLFPDDPYAKTRIRLWTKAVDEDLHPACAAVTFMISHRHTVARLGAQGTEDFLSATPALSVTADWSTLKRLYIEMGLEAPGGADKIRLYDLYLHKMEDALNEHEWLVGDDYSIADASLTPYVNRLAMMQMSGMWKNGRLPGVTAWFDRVRARESFQSAVLDWVPEQLTDDFRNNGAKSWPEVAKVMGIQEG